MAISFEYAKDRGSILIHARVNGKPVLLIVDTGSSHTIVRPALLGINARELSRLQPGPGLTGDAIGREVMLEVGSQVWPKQRVSVMDLTTVLGGYREQVDGLLGLDVLLEFSETDFNWKDRVVNFIR